MVTITMAIEMNKRVQNIIRPTNCASEWLVSSVGFPVTLQIICGDDNELELYIYLQQPVLSKRHTTILTRVGLV